MPSLRGLAVTAVVLLLAGCSAPATVTGSGATTAPPAASASPSADAATLPSDFPTDIPLISGDIVTASSTGNGWEVWIASSDPIDGYGQASSSLQNAGFTAIADQSINGAAGGVFD
ncbi:MAG: hypothetical protein ABUL47_08445, partial [Leifsonia sp.]